MRITAILATYNEERFIANCLKHLFRQGVEVYLMDNDSEDETVAIARRYLDHGLIGMERFPRDSVFQLERQLKRKEELAATLPGDWFMHLDADEIHTPARSDRTLAQALAQVEDSGYNAVNFQEYTFTPTQESPDHDHAEYMKTMHYYYPFTPRFPHRLNAWKRQPGRVDLATSAGHIVQFPGLHMCPNSFCMRHYLFLSAAHAQQKYGRMVYDPVELSRGWYGTRKNLRPRDVRLLRQADMRLYISDERFDPSNPLTRHPLFD